MKRDNKKALYESIMNSVAREVKKALNESDFYNENIIFEQRPIFKKYNNDFEPTGENIEIQHKMINLDKFIKGCLDKHYFTKNIADSFKTRFGNPNKFSSILNYIHFQVYEDIYNTYDIISTLLVDGNSIVRYYEKYNQDVNDWCQNMADELINKLDNFINENKEYIFSLYRSLCK